MNKHRDKIRIGGKSIMQASLKCLLPVFALSACLFLVPGRSVVPCYASQKNAVLSLKNISASEKDGEYFIWFYFNRAPGSAIGKIDLNDYGLEAKFKNSISDINPKFVKFDKNRLFKAAEIMGTPNGGLNAAVYFRGNVKINKKDVYATVYGRYFIIKVRHVFIGGAFGKIGKNLPASAALPVSSGFSKSPAAKASVPPPPAAVPHAAGAFPFAAKGAHGLNMGFEVVKTLIYLALIIGLIYAVYFLMNKLKNRVSSKEKLNNLRVASSVNIGNKKSILLIEVNGEMFVVGVSPSGIQVIGRVDARNNNILTGEAAYDLDGPSSGLAPDTGNTASEIAEVSSFKAAQPHSSAPASSVKSYGKFSDVLKEHASAYNPAKLSGTAREDNVRDAGFNFKPDTLKVKNINEAKFKNKADNVFFDIEERLKGLMESNGNSKKF